NRPMGKPPCGSATGGGVCLLYVVRGGLDVSDICTELQEARQKMPSHGDSHASKEIKRLETWSKTLATKARRHEGFQNGIKTKIVPSCLSDFVAKKSKRFLRPLPGMFYGFAQIRGDSRARKLSECKIKILLKGVPL
ncbi:MAG: hypothetical protein WD182_08045, partial [Bacteroidota bacterium]